jgi:hypothetical protein
VAAVSRVIVNAAIAEEGSKPQPAEEPSPAVTDAEGEIHDGLYTEKRMFRMSPS